MPFDKYDKDVALFGGVWIAIVAILLYFVFKPRTDSNPAMGT